MRDLSTYFYCYFHPLMVLLLIILTAHIFIMLSPCHFLCIHDIYTYFLFCDTSNVSTSGDGVYDMIYYYYLIFDIVFFDEVKQGLLRHFRSYFYPRSLTGVSQSLTIPPPQSNKNL